MALPEQTLYNLYTPDGDATSFAFNFCVFDEDDLKVYQDDVLVAAANYTVSGVGTRAGGTVTFTTAPIASVAELKLKLEPSYARTEDYQQGGSLHADTVDNDMDRMHSLLQFQDAVLGRTLTFADETATGMELAGDDTARASKLMGFDSSGDPILYSMTDITASVPTAYAETLLDDATSAEARATLETVTAAMTQEGVRYTTSGSAPNYAITTSSPVVSAYAAGQRFTVVFHATTSSGGPTLNVNALGGKNLYQYDAGGNKRYATCISGQIAIVEYDGTDMVILNPLPIYPLTNVRQTVQGGPVSSVGLPNFLPSTDADLNLGTQNISSTYPLVVSASQGFGVASDRIGSTTSSLTFTCTDAATNYLYVTVGSDGTLTAGTTTVQPVFQYGGTPAVTSGLGTFDYSTMTMYVGNGATAPAAWRVYVGEAVAAAGAITSTVCYAYNGFYESAQYGLALPAQYNTPHNVGAPSCIETVLVCTDAGGEGGYAQNDYLPLPAMHYDGGVLRGGTTSLSASNKSFTSSICSLIIVQNKAANSFVSLTASKWKLKTRVKRVF